MLKCAWLVLSLALTMQTWMHLERRGVYPLALIRKSNATFVFTFSDIPSRIPGIITASDEYARSIGLHSDNRLVRSA